MLPKRLNCTSASTEFSDTEIKRCITDAEADADRALLRIIKSEEQLTKLSTNIAKYANISLGGGIMLKPKDMASRLNVSVRTLQRWDNEGILTAQRTPTNRRYYTEDQVRQYLHPAERTKWKKK